jgi:hypothetical protein
MTINDIVKKYLEENGFDGLFSQYCGCRIDDLIPCGEICMDCEPGYIKKQNTKDSKCIN